MDHSLKRPIIQMRCQPSTHGIILNIRPFLSVIFMSAKLCIPTVTLPHRTQLRKTHTDQSFPISRPTRDTLRFMPCWRTKQMDMIRHDHISSDVPVIGGIPCFPHSSVYFCIGKNTPALSRTNCKKNKYRFVRSFCRRVMCRTFAFRQVFR